MTPDGVVGEAERVQPITSREEFLSCADEIYGLLNMLTSKYVLADIGSRYFMNYGLRGNNFGPVLLDFPYLYEVDGNKLVCSAPNYNEPSGNTKTTAKDKNMFSSATGRSVSKHILTSTISQKTRKG